ncbi:hypothetical protein PF005_g12716 [Phytophthora fragariae]|uniref:EIF3F/CSN6-like C-terminal domain-containing protein n=2 Tax=Phytophthora TaxID=4783 RepID=A0A6A3XRN9_9STRA|nr:hypothetical protein PF003_g54 [Phytophthora fragariae]KAE9029322.1 hypothetical protein PR002_g10168 [Phytophthora rubi]KAE8938390.1 hypothetical protein PF009_g11730 [Phytophthora fragariae]KAE9009042.1 hypothetical protein PF011_g10457 [Phytophthora fragariae]KAE9034948.1 hypothetical protein PR001_g9507 [Phytophthora rubi]
MKHFDAAFTQEYNDALLVSYLATLTKGATNANTVFENAPKNPKISLKKLAL